MLSIDDALAITEELVRRTVARGHAIEDVLVLVGGSALAAHGVRALSEDLDLYVRNYSEDVAAELEAELVAVHGPAFKLDITSTENLWGMMMVRDILDDSTPAVRRFTVGSRSFEVKALSIETCFLLKLAADRDVDRADVALLAMKTTADKVIARFNTLIRWHGERYAVTGLSDSFVEHVAQFWTRDARQIIDALTLPQHVKAALLEARGFSA